MNKSTEEIFKKLSDKITLIYDLEFAKSLPKSSRIGYRA